MKIKVDIDPAAILQKRGLGPSNAARVFMASEVGRLCEPYVPMESGALKNSSQVTNGGKQLKYPGPYAHYQYEGQVYGPNIPLGDGGFFSPTAPKHPTGKALTYHGAPMRGPAWDKRMKADRMDELVRSVADEVGGRPK